MELFGSVIVLVDDAAAWPASADRWRQVGLYPMAVTADGRAVDAHLRAWQRAIFQGEPTLVATSRMGPADAWGVVLAQVDERMAGDAWHVLHLDEGHAGDAYLVSPAGAELLLEAAPLDRDVAAAMAAIAALDIRAVEPAAVDAGHDGGADAGDTDAATPTDVGRLLGYRGALPASSELVEVGPELVTLPFWTPEFCALVINAAEAVDAWAADEHDPVPGHEVSLTLISPRLAAHVEDHVAAAVVPALREQWPTLEYHGLRDAFVIRYTDGDVEGLRLHHDVAQVSGSVKLNAGYAGGELVFPRQELSNEGLPVGTLLAWPSLVTHPHAAEPVRSGTKYGLTLWFEVPGPR